MNALLADWDTPFGLPPYGAFAENDFAPAFETAFAQARDEIAAIADNPAPPSFDNTILAMERASATLRKVSATFFGLAGTDSSPAIEELQRKISPEFAAFNAEVMMNAALYARVIAVDEAGGLDPIATRLLALTREEFERAGAALNDADGARLKAIMERLATLSTSFTQNVLADERDWYMELDEAGLVGLPDDLIAAAKGAAEARGLKGHIVTLSRSLVVPFLQYSPRRDLRETAQAAWEARGANGGETDNTRIAAEILSLRAERAALLGFNDFATYKLAPEMAKTPEAVRDLLMAVWSPAKEKVRADLSGMESLLAKDGITGPLQRSDVRYYSEKLRQAAHDFDEAALKPYLSLDAMIGAAFDCATRLFGLTFQPVDAPLHHPDARAWDVQREGRHMGLFVGDFFNRPGKRSGAWCSRLRPQSSFDGEVRPIVTNTCNFAKPGEGQHALLTFDDARTLFHEFGHALHHLLSEVPYPSMAGTAVARDWVELPSQLYEHWLTVPDVLRTHALHVETGEPIPEAMVERVLAAENFDQGFATVEYVASAIVDLEFHTGAPPQDVMQAQAEILDRMGMPDAVAMRHATPHFQHVFSGDGYAAGYYSYMWSEVMDADAFAAFEETGNAFDAETAGRLEAMIYSTGNSQPPDELYRAFRGGLPEVGALLKQRGLAGAA